MKKLIFPILLVLCITSTYSQWVANYGNSNGDINFANAKGNAVTTDAFEFSYVTGNSYEGVYGNDIITIKYTPTGETEWVRGFNGSASSNDNGTGICVDALGNVYVVGSVQNLNRGYDIVVIKYNSSGTQLWFREYYSFNIVASDMGTAIAVDAFNNIYVTGYTTNTDGYTDIFTGKYDDAGNTLWIQLEDGPTDLNSQGLCISVSSAGNVYVGGFVSETSTNSDIAIVKYNSAGTLQWLRSISGNGNSEDKAWGIVVDETDNIYITGYVTVAAGNTDCYTAKFNSAGVSQWSKTYDGEGNQSDKAWGIVVDTDGSVFISGENTDASSNVNYLTVMYSSSGDLSWAKHYNGTGNGVDVANSIGILSNSNNTKSIIITGKSWGTNFNYDYATVRYDIQSGTQLNVNRYSFTVNSDDIAKSLSISPSNKVIVTGFSQLIIEASHEVSYISTLSLDWGSEMLSDPIVPKSFSLYQNYPNPFNPSTSIKFDLIDASQVKLAIYDMLGRVVDVLVNQQLNAGTHKISFNAGNLASGVYFYKLETGSFSDIKKMTLIK